MTVPTNTKAEADNGQNVHAEAARLLRVWLAEGDCECEGAGHSCGKPNVLRVAEQLEALSSQQAGAAGASVLTDAQITAGSNILCDCPRPKRIGRNAAIDVFQAMTGAGATPAQADTGATGADLPPSVERSVQYIMDAVAWYADHKDESTLARIRAMVTKLELDSAQLARQRQGEPVAITPDERAAFHRFCECCEDFDSGGYDVDKDMMAKLACIGLVRSIGFGRYETTKFGDWLRNATPPASQAVQGDGVRKPKVPAAYQHPTAPECVSVDKHAYESAIPLYREEDQA